MQRSPHTYHWLELPCQLSEVLHHVNVLGFRQRYGFQQAVRHLCGRGKVRRRGNVRGCRQVVARQEMTALMHPAAHLYHPSLQWLA